MDYRSWLTETDSEKLATLWRQADQTRRAHRGDAVHLRGLIELSNHCRCRCAYCGINASNSQIVRYRMTKEDVLPSLDLASQFGYGTIVFQAGEDLVLSEEFISDLVRTVKNYQTISGIPFAVTLSLGQRPIETLARWREAGADRYLMRFETSNPKLFAHLHPHDPDGLENRVQMLRVLKSLGFMMGTGFLIGVPGQTAQDWVNDLDLLNELQPDMVGIGPYLPHPQTTLAHEPPNLDVLADKLTTLKTLSLIRLLLPDSFLPSTTALAALDVRHGHEDGLCCGANVIMPNLTPLKYRRLYEIYPSKANTSEAAQEYDKILKSRIQAIGRTVGKGPGGI